VSAEIVTRDLFAASSPTEITTAAAEVADQLADVVRQRKMTMRIGTREHILVEGWQTLGALTGVFAVGDGGVRTLEWPFEPPALTGEERELAEQGLRKDARKRDEQEKHQITRMRQHRAHELGASWGFAVAFNAVRSGEVIGWGEGSCTREEATWAGREDYALRGMAQTRGQSRTLAAPLKFIVKLSGYATTPAEEMDGVESPPPAAPEQPFGVMAHVQEVKLAIEALEHAWPQSQPRVFMRGLDQKLGQMLAGEGAPPLGGMPNAAVTALREWAWWVGQQVEQTGAEPERTEQHQGADAPQQGDAQSVADPTNE